MRRALLSMPVAVAMTLVGCEAILGIPSDMERDGDAGLAVDATDEAEPTPEADATPGLPPTLDGGADGGPDADAALPPSCDVTRDFQTPKNITELNTSLNEGSPRLSDDELTLYFDAERPADGPGFDVYAATRTSLDAPFGAPVKIPGVRPTAAGFNVYAPNVSSDGKSIVYSLHDTGAGNVNIMKATRASVSVPFGVGAAIANINTADFEASPFMRGDTGEIWFAVSRSGAHTDIYEAHFVAGTGYTVSKAKNVNTDADDQDYPVISDSRLALYFAVGPLGLPANPTDIWVATRTKITDDFAGPIPVPNVNSASNDAPGWISRDGCRLYLTSSRPGGAGLQDLYVAARPK